MNADETITRAIIINKSRIEHIFQFMEYDELSDGQLDLVISFEDQFKSRGFLSDKQYEILEDIFKRAAEK